MDADPAPSAAAGSAGPDALAPARLELALGRRDLVELVLTSLLLSLVFGVGFYALDDLNHARVQRGAAAWQPETALDAWVPFSPAWVWPYLVYFPLCFLPLLFCGRIERFRLVARSYALTYVPCLALFSVVPTKMDRPAFEVVDAATAWVRRVYDFDPGYNIFPSLHVANAVLVAWIVQRWAPRAAWVTWLLAAAISASTVLVKQHYLVDVPAGAALGTAAFFLTFRRAPG